MRILIFCVVLLAACNTAPKVPEGVMPPEKMKAILWDLIKADGVIATRPASDTSQMTLERRTQWYAKVMYLHGTTKTAFSKSLTYYESRPDLLKPIFTSLHDSVQRAPSFKKDSSAAKKDSAVIKAMQKGLEAL